jgi:hypothetical protein
MDKILERYSPRVRNILEYAICIANDKNHAYVDVHDLVEAIIKELNTNFEID